MSVGQGKQRQDAVGYVDELCTYVTQGRESVCANANTGIRQVRSNESGLRMAKNAAGRNKETNFKVSKNTRNSRDVKTARNNKRERFTIRFP